MSHIGPAIECSPSAIPTPAVFGAEILSLEASWVRNFTLDVPGNFNYNHGAQSVQNVDFCNVTVTYSHPGYDTELRSKPGCHATGTNACKPPVEGDGVRVASSCPSFSWEVPLERDTRRQPLMPASGIQCQTHGL